MRNYLLLALLAIALAGFFYWCFGDDWISIGIFTACIVFPVSILLEGSLTKTERDRIFVIYIIAFFVIFFWAAYEQAGASLTLFASEQTNRVILGLGNAGFLDTVIQSILCSDTCSHHAGSMGLPQ